MKLEKLEPLDSPNYLRLIFEDGKRLKAPAFKVVELGLTPGAEVTPEAFLALENAQSLASCKERAVRILTASGLSKRSCKSAWSRRVKARKMPRRRLRGWRSCI